MLPEAKGRFCPRCLIQVDSYATYHGGECALSHYVCSVCRREWSYRMLLTEGETEEILEKVKAGALVDKDRLSNLGGGDDG